MRINMRRNVYRYKLLTFAREKGSKIEWLRVWVKQSIHNYKYKYYPIILTYSNRFGYFVQKKFKSISHLLEFLKLSTALTQPGLCAL